MKTLVIASIIAAFCVSAVQAGENKDQSCASKTTCCAEKAAKAKADLTKARATASEKGAYQLVKR